MGGRVGGCLAVSRALGDFEFKFNGLQYVHREYQVSNVADIRSINITDATQFLILACHGRRITSREPSTAQKRPRLTAPEFSTTVPRRWQKPPWREEAWTTCQWSSSRSTSGAGTDRLDNQASQRFVYLHVKK